LLFWQVVREGFEQSQEYSNSAALLGCAAQINALGLDFDGFPYDLVEVIEAWSHLSDAVRATILALVRDSTKLS
jgi:hypothetical protein